jgi:hypothetical protein
MEFKNKHLRYELTDGDICIAEVSKDFHSVGYVVCYYKDGHLYDVLALENDDMSDDHWTLLDDVCEKFMFIGKNIYKD